MKRALALSALVAVLASGACADRDRAFRVDVRPQLVSRSGDSVSLTYTVRVGRATGDSLSSFMVDAPGLLWAQSPGDDRSWMAMTKHQSRSVASWAPLTRMIHPGESTPALLLIGRGLLGVVPYWAKLSAPLDSVISDGPDTEVVSAMRDLNGVRGDNGSTVGIVRFPADRSPSALAARLASLIGEACGLRWIVDRAVCEQLRNDAKPDARSLGAMQRDLDAQRGNAVSEAAYVLLSDNVGFLIRALSQANTPAPFWPRRDNLVVTVQAKVVELGGDTVRITWHVTNVAGSEQAAVAFVVRTDLAPASMTGPARWISGKGPIADSAAIEWRGMGLDSRIRPGEDLDALSATFVGLVDIAAWRVRGAAPNPSLGNRDSRDVPGAPSVWQDAAKGLTIGAAPLPSEATAATLEARLSSLLTRSCELHWVRPQDSCNALRSEVDSATRNLGLGNVSATRAELDLFVKDIDARWGRDVSPEAVALLTQAAHAVLRHL
jgi:hypothetical protein